MTLRNEYDRAVILSPSALSISAKEDGQAIVPADAAYAVAGPRAKQMKSVLVLDYSKSTADIAANGDSDGDGLSDAVETMEASAKTYINSLNEDALTAIYEFHREDKDPSTTGKVAAFTTDKEYLGGRIDAIWTEFVKPAPNLPRVWDAVYAAVTEFPAGIPKDEQRFIVVLSNGRDTGSRYSPTQVANNATIRGIHIYCIGFGADLSPANLQNLATSTGGQYYKASSVADIAVQYQNVISDLRGQYVLRWATLRRSTTTFLPTFDISWSGVSDSATGTYYRPTDYSGDILHGKLRIPAYAINRAKGTATVFLRASYVPQNVRQFSFYVSTFYPFTVSKVSSESGGLCGNWPAPTVSSVAGSPYDYIIDLASPNPQVITTSIPYGALGPILRFDFNGLPSDAPAELFQLVAINNTIYSQTGGQSFEIEGWAQPPDPSLSVAPTSINLTEENPSATLLVSNMGGFVLSWSSTWNDSGITVSPWRATGNNTQIAISAGEMTPRRVPITFTNTSNPANTVTVWAIIGEPPVIVSLPGGESIELVRIPAGTYRMGSPNTDFAQEPDELPLHDVAIGYNFYMGRTEVTQGQWYALMGMWPGGTAAPATNLGKGANYPVYYVAWDDAKSFVAALNAYIESSGQGPLTVRLPSEAEWEYACRARSTTRFCFGDSDGVGDDCENDGTRSLFMWYCGSAWPSGGCSPVALKKLNAFGLYDMHGNLYEWCEDSYFNSYNGAPTDGSARVSDQAPFRVMRGGYYMNEAMYCRSANRSFDSPNIRYFRAGFRLAADR